MAYHTYTTTTTTTATILQYYIQCIMYCNMCSIYNNNNNNESHFLYMYMYVLLYLFHSLQTKHREFTKAIFVDQFDVLIASARDGKICETFCLFVCSSGKWYREIRLQTIIGFVLLYCIDLCLM